LGVVPVSDSVIAWSVSVAGTDWMTPPPPPDGGGRMSKPNAWLTECPSVSVAVSVTCGNISCDRLAVTANVRVDALKAM